MSTIRMSELVWRQVHQHLFSRQGEHFAFLLAPWTYSQGEPVFVVREAILVPSRQVKVSRHGYTVTPQAIVNAVNAAVRTGDALIEVHNHGGSNPRYSHTDSTFLPETVSYMLDSLFGRPYAATVWGDSDIYGQFFLANGTQGIIESVTVLGDRLRQVASVGDEYLDVSRFDRQLPWFTEEGQRALGHLRIGVVGAGGTGSHVIQNLAYLGVRRFVLVDNDAVDRTNMNRLVTASMADLETPKTVVGRRLIRSIAPETEVTLVQSDLRSTEALDALKGVDVVFGCVDNDGARLILNEFTLAYAIPYFDIATGIDADGGRVSEIGGRVAIVLQDGPCLCCMSKISIEEAAFFLSSPEQRAVQIDRGYVEGMDVKAPSVVSLNGLVAAVAVNEFAVLVSGLRPVNPETDFDLLGVHSTINGQWVTPRRGVKARVGCIQCMVKGIGDATRIDRYINESARRREP